MIQIYRIYFITHIYKHLDRNMCDNTKPNKGKGQFTKDTGIHTFSLGPKYQHELQPNRILIIMDELIHSLSKLPQTMTYRIYPEIKMQSSDLVNGFIPRIHFHGTIKFEKGAKTEFYAEHVYTLSNFYSMEIDTIDTEQIWIDYMAKDMEDMSHYLKKLNRDPLIVNETKAQTTETKINLDKIQKALRDYDELDFGITCNGSTYKSEPKRNYKKR